MTFIQEHFTLLIGILFVGIFFFQAVRMLKKAKKIDNEGIETNAVVSKIEETYDTDAHSSSYTAYVQYRDSNGVMHESPVSVSAQVPYSVGEQIRIRYIPSDDELVREVKD